MTRKIIALIVLVSAVCECYCQVDFFTDFHQLAANAHGKKFMGQFLKGAKNGMGISFEKDGLVYIGDFVKNKKNGMGLLFNPKNAKKNKFPDATVIVGKWQDDYLRGTAKCYDEQGRLIYSGIFENNEPVGEYPQEPDDDFLLSRIIIENNDIFIGETFCGYPNGFGILVFSDGTIWQSEFNYGSPIGLGLLIDSNLEWQTIKYNDSGEATTISSSKEYAQLDAMRSQFTNSLLSEALESFSSAINIGLGMASGQYSSTVAIGMQGVSAELTANSDGSISANGGNYVTMYANWERRAKANYESLTNLGYSVTKDGKNVSGNSGQGSSPSNFVRQKQLLREAQKEMACIRQKAAKAGITINQSEYETISVSY